MLKIAKNVWIFKKTTTTFEFPSVSYVAFFYPVLPEVFPDFASFGVVHFFRFIFRASDVSTPLFFQPKIVGFRLNIILFVRS